MESGRRMDDFRIAVKSFIVKDNKLLIIKRNFKDTHKPKIWEIPGGRLNLGENPFTGLKRETKEETGLDIEILNPLNVKHFIRDDKQKITMVIFLCKALNDDMKLGEEHSEFDWIKIEKCKEKLSEFFHKEVDLFKSFYQSKV